MKRQATIVIPVFNEEAQLAGSIARLAAFLRERHDWESEIVIADNGSTDGTLQKAHLVADEYGMVRVLHLDAKGRGRALKTAWLQSRANILCYMDVDLSTDLAALPALIEAIAQGGYDVAIGSRLMPGSEVVRGWKRDWISRCYNQLVKAMFRTRFSDAQCGFKAISATAADALLPLVEDTGWFFDTELLVVAEKLSWRICDVPVRWVDDSDSRVKIVRTAWADLKGLARVRRNLAAGRYHRPGESRAACSGEARSFRS